MLEDAEAVYVYLQEVIGYSEKQIIVFGRSIGSAPATWLAAKKNPGALILMSAFTSLRGVVKDLVGTLGSYLVRERFNNLENI